LEPRFAELFDVLRPFDFEFELRDELLPFVLPADELFPRERLVFFPALRLELAPDRALAAFFAVDRALLAIFLTALFVARAPLLRPVALAASAPTTPPTTIPTGPPTLPTTAPATAPAASRLIGGISILSDSLSPCCGFEFCAIIQSPNFGFVISSDQMTPAAVPNARCWRKRPGAKKRRSQK
jgi:hypothetical protein